MAAISRKQQYINSLEYGDSEECMEILEEVNGEFINDGDYDYNIWTVYTSGIDSEDFTEEDGERVCCARLSKLLEWGLDIHHWDDDEYIMSDEFIEGCDRCTNTIRNGGNGVPNFAIKPAK